MKKLTNQTDKSAISWVTQDAEKPKGYKMSTLVNKCKEPEKFKKILAFADYHYPEHVDPIPMLRYARDVFKPNIVILGGDMIDFDSICHFDSKKFPHRGYTNVRKAFVRSIEEFNLQLDLFQHWLPEAKFYYIKGNHERFLDDFCLEHPQLQDLVLSELFRFKARNIEYVINRNSHDSLGGRLKLGKMVFQHGENFGSDNPPKQASMRTFCNVFFFHHHSYKTWSCFDWADTTQRRVSVTLPCFCHRAPAYGKNRPNSWMNGFLTAYVKNTGNFTFNVTLVSPKGHFIAADKEWK